MRAILRSLSIRQKLLISSLLYIVPLAMLLYFTLSGIRADIRFAETEKLGAKLAGPLEELMVLVSAHRSLAYLNSQGKTEVQGRLSDTAKKIDSVFVELLAESAEFAPRLKLDEENMKRVNLEEARPVRIKEAWDRLRSRMGELIPEMCELEHTNIIAALRNLIARVGDTSKLILDPELSSNYLADTTLRAVPLAIEQLGDLTLAGQQIISRGNPGGQELSRFEFLIASINSGSLRQMQELFAAAVRYDAQMRGNRSTLGQGATQALNKCFDSMRYLLQSARVLKGASKGESLQEFSVLGEATTESVGRFKNEALKELDLLLDDRMDRYNGRMYTIVYLAIFCLALAGGLVFVISLGITRPLEKVMSLAGEIAEGNINGASAQIGRLGLDADGASREETAELSRYRDEIWQLAAVFVHMTRALDSLVLQVQRSGIQVVASSTEISAASRQIEATAAAQAASTHELNVTAKGISTSCRLLLESVKRVLEVASETLSLAQEGHQRLAGMKLTMGELMKATSSISS
ncbi:MAG: methyl-accepting chemotaxis protein, partial [Desulfobacteraceae bacterium]|nr:methyl-accepting chemotaxis protein [Desulfobacteraceae bacterium]